MLETRKTSRFISLLLVLALSAACAPALQKAGSGASASPTTGAAPARATPPEAPHLQAAAASAQAPSAAATLPETAALPIDPACAIGTLDNGLTYYIRKNAKPEKRAELWLAVNAGSTLEDDDQQGLAHFVEHMAFNGTKNFKKQELVNYLEKIGMRFGPDLNAFTSFDETVYLLKVPTDDPAIVATAFQILEDWAHAVTFEDEEIDKERGVGI